MKTREQIARHVVSYLAQALAEGRYAEHEVTAAESAIFAIEAQGDDIIDTLDILTSQVDFPNDADIILLMDQVQQFQLEG